MRRRDSIQFMHINKDGKIFIVLVALLIVTVAGITYTVTKEVKSGQEAELNTNITHTEKTMDITTAQTSENKGGLQITDEVVGTGAEAVAGKSVTVHYTGTLLNGKKFDSSKDRGTPFTFDLGAGQVIKGWDQDVAGMKIGGKRKLVIPAELAYGNRDVGNGLIPANSTLVFEVELLDVK